MRRDAAGFYGVRMAAPARKRGSQHLWNAWPISQTRDELSKRLGNELGILAEVLLYCEMIAPIIADILVNLARIHIDAKIVVTPVNGERDEVSWKSIVASTIGRGLFHQ